ncbi:UTRA domain-containing protein [Acidisoma cellulosilytica]|uniref:UTRA domain-containing protein n=1 Tax=Acidisoma cellulosilyticum TaxID=2802395 RepID=A0A964E5S9_9PROT|nr:UTRA domain-containing protein [Acidisoma cellulosilyticum]MCB8882854.1 UTRA domain-containing protein [Acidisoma cellulosilyticum]
MNLSDRIRADIETRILSGEWKPGHPIPAEHALMAEYGCARMTVNKAIAAMAADGLVTRRRRAGTVVAAPAAERAVMEIADLAEESASLGLSYRFTILARAVEETPRGPMLSITTLHERDGAPLALEERRISLSAVPEAAGESFDDAPPGTWLLQHVAWSEAEHVIGAHAAEPVLARRLGIAPGAACLTLDRRTWQGGEPITEVRLTYPASRHRFTSRFAQQREG